MPPRIHLRPAQLRSLPKPRRNTSLQICRHASAAVAITPAPSIDQGIAPVIPIQRWPSSQPPSYRRPDFRKTQLHRQYTSLLHSTPLILLFQHNNLLAQEWIAIRRELKEAMRKVDEAESTPYADFVKIQIVKTGIFDHALRVVEFFQPEHQQTNPLSGTAADPTLNHLLSKTAHDAAADPKLKHGLEPLLTGPLALLTIPAVSPAHLRAAFSIVAPSAPNFPAPKRRTNPSYYDAAVQNGLPKLMLLGARIEGKVFDTEGARWVGGIPGGLQGLRAQLVAMLQGVGAGVTTALETAGRSVYYTMESRKAVLEEEASPKEKDTAEAPKESS